MCPCGCGKEDHSDNGSMASSTGMGTTSLPSPPPSYPVSLPNSPDLSPLKTAVNHLHHSVHVHHHSEYDGPLDMSKTSPVFGTTTPPPSPPENDRDKFRCLYLLVDAAVGQLEQLEREKQQLCFPTGRVCA